MRDNYKGVFSFLAGSCALLVALSLICRWLSIGTSIDVGHLIQQHDRELGIDVMRSPSTGKSGLVVA